MCYTNKMCYICLKDDCNELSPLSQIDADNISYETKLKICLQTELCVHEYTDVCNSCLQQLELTYKFLQTAQATQVALRNGARANSPKDVVDDDKSIKDDDDSKTEEEHKCELCESRFVKRWQLQKHKLRMHLAERKYACEHCDKVFKQSYHLAEHVRSHTGEKIYECNFCGKKFSRVSSQRRHARSHEAAPGLKSKRTPFLCTICGKSFPFSNGVQRHMRVHLGIKRHECTVCSRKFNQSTHLHVHMRTHTGERPYICEECGVGFSLNSSLQKHMLAHRDFMKDENLDGYKVLVAIDGD